MSKNLLRFLKSDPNTRKIFGARELKIIEKQLLGMDLTQSEKNRLSRDIRKKLEFIKDISRFSDNFDLKKSAIIKDIIEESKKIILESKYFRDIRRIHIFGSSIDNKRTFRSDIDIAVEFNGITLKKATEFRISMSGKLDDKVDIQVYDVLPEKIRKEIDEKGRTIYKEPDR